MAKLKTVEELFKGRHFAEAKSVLLKEKIAGLRRQMRALKVMEQTVQDAPDQQVSLTDPDARSMATSGKGTSTVGYNVRIAMYRSPSTPSTI